MQYEERNYGYFSMDSFIWVLFNATFKNKNKIMEGHLC